MNDNWGADQDELEAILPSCHSLKTEELENNTHPIILSVNMRGVRNNVSTLNELISNSRNVKIIAVSETFDIDSNKTNNCLEDYTLVTRIRKDNPARGGCGFFIHSSLQFEEIELDGSFNEGNFETLSIRVPLLKIIATSLYRPNGHANACATRFTNSLSNHIRTIAATPNFKKYSHYYCGDFNLDILKPTINVNRDYIDTMITSLYTPMIDTATRITNHSASGIDQIWTNSPQDITRSFVITDHQVADHLTIGVILEEKLHEAAKTIQKRIFSDENVKKFKKELDETNFAEVYAERDTHKKWTLLQRIIREKLEHTCPLKTVNIKPGKFRRKIPYMTEGLKNSSKTLSRLNELSTKNPNQILPGNTETNWELYWNFRKLHSEAK